MDLKKATITDEHRQEAEALKRIWRSTEHPSQPEFGELYEIGNQSAVSQFLNGKSALSLKAAIGFAKGLGCKVEDFSPRLAMQLASASDVSSIPSGSFDIQPPRVSRQKDNDSVVFEVLDVRAACGDGYANDDHPEVVSTMFIPAQVAQAMIGTTNRSGSVKIVTAAKDSMAPTINPDDLLFVDTSITEYSGETVYLIRHGGELLCKRLSLVGRDIVVSSDNKNYESWKWSDKPDETRIIGRVVRVLPIQFKKFSSD